jgi:hypothetical protein
VKERDHLEYLGGDGDNSIIDLRMFQCDDEERLNCLEKNSDAFLENAS